MMSGNRSNRVRRREVPQALNRSTAQPIGRQRRFEFDDDKSATPPRWVEVNASGVRVENLRQFGGPWIALHLIRTLELDSFLERTIPEGRERVGWDVSSLILIIARLLEPSSELHTAEQWYPKTALPDRLGVPEQTVDDNRLYRTMERRYGQRDRIWMMVRGIALKHNLRKCQPGETNAEARDASQYQPRSGHPALAHTST